ncbi:MAG TPA: type I secretion system permease/ATPase [Micropepsaceae bacterium]|nr:type I secretion system permease/ATPase [Micropepsaceae bacterium]
MAGFGNLGRPAARPDPVREAFAANARLLSSIFGFSAAMSLLTLTTSFYMLEVYDRVLTSRSQETLILLTAIAVGALAIMGMLDSLRLRILTRIGMRIGDALAARTLRAMVAVNSQTGSMSARSGLRDIDTIRNFVGSQSFATLIDMPFAIVLMVVLYFLHPFYLLIVLGGGAILVGLTVLNNRVSGRITADSIGQSMRAHNFAEDGLRNADVLEGMGMSSTFVDRWRRQWVGAMRTNSRASDREARISATSKAVRLLIQVALMATGAILILDFKATGGVMLGATIIGSRALQPIEQAIGMWKNIIAVRLARVRLSELLLNAPKREEGMALPAPTGQIQANSVHYVPQGARKPILTNINFELAAGEAMGVIGPSASGKSTLARLLVGAWPPSAGVVRLDGANIYAWPRKELSHYIGYLPQDVELFTGTIRDNIARMGDGDPAAVVRAAELAHAHQMILALPKGYDTEIGENGYRLSAGQSQRVGLARALFGDPRLVVLDEPNSNLDGPGEEALIQTIASLKALNVTVIVIAHRPSVLADMDKMLVLQANGTVAAFGSKAEVLAQYSRAPTARPQGPNVVPLATAHGSAVEPTGSAGS